MIQERRRIEFLTEAASGFRGLPMMIFGLILFAAMLLNFWAEIDSQKGGYKSKDLTWTGIFGIISLIAFLVVYPKLRESLGNRFGRTQAKAKTYRSVTIDLLCFVPLLFGFIFGTSIDAAYQLPFSLTIAGVAIFAFSLWWLIYRGVSRGILYFSISIFAISIIDWEKIIPLTDFTSRATFYRCLASVFLGLVYFAGGVIDYKILKTSFRSDAPHRGSL